jgi:branched-chain amino acid aminotransferase
MKAYKDREGKIRLFRPEKNMARLNHSMTRLAMPSFNGEGFLECLKALLQLDSSWIPDQEGYSMYIRPTAIGTSPYLGVEAAQHVKLYAILSPVGPYYRSGFKPVKLYADTVHTRAWPGGVGNAKVRQNVSFDSVCELFTRLRRDSSAVNLSYSLPIDSQ